jgi:hypothetical protein
MEMILKLGNGFKAFIALCCVVATTGLGLCDVVINEVELSAPDDGTVWVELYNSGDLGVDLTGWTIKILDEAWVGSIPLQGIIDPKGFIATDGQPAWVTTGNGTVYLYDSSGNEVDKTSQQSDDSHTDFTYGRLPDGKKTNTNADFAFMMESKGRSNGKGVQV